MDISTELIKDMRTRTGVGVMECKKYLKLSKGDIEEAIDLMRKDWAQDDAVKINTSNFSNLTHCEASAEYITSQLNRKID